MDDGGQDNGFGFTRIVRPGSGPHRFEPESVGEIAVVRDLERANVSVVLYLGSAQRKIKGPVLVTRANAPLAEHLTMPDAEGLRPELTSALRAFRAADTCLRCHDVSLGDPVGVVMYGYRHTPPSGGRAPR